MVLGLKSRNGRYYTPQAAAAAIPLYEGVAVCLDHPADSMSVRSVRDRFGRLENVRLAGTRIKADLVYNVAHPFAPTLEWFAENDPTAVGLSHNAECEGWEADDGTFVITAVVEVRGVDLVTDPATTRGLFESFQHLVYRGPRRRPVRMSNEEFAQLLERFDRLPRPAPHMTTREFADLIDGEDD
jgi:hypothetical protein